MEGLNLNGLNIKNGSGNNDDDAPKNADNNATMERLAFSKKSDAKGDEGESDNDDNDNLNGDEPRRASRIRKESDASSSVQTQATINLDSLGNMNVNSNFNGMNGFNGLDFELTQTNHHKPPPPISSNNPTSNNIPTDSHGSNVPLDQERQLLILMLLSQVCALHDSTPKTFIIHLLSLYESCILDRENIRFLFDMGLLPSQLLDTPSNGGNNNEDENEDATGNNISSERQHLKETQPDSPASNSSDVQSLTADTTTAYDIDMDHQTIQDESKSKSEADYEQNIKQDVSNSVAAIVPYKNAEGMILSSPNAISPSADPSSANHNNTQFVQERQRRREWVSRVREYLLRQDSSNSNNTTNNASSSTTTTSATGQDIIIHNPHPSYQRQESSTSTNTTSWSIDDHPLRISRYNREFLQQHLLASGSFGQVYCATYKLDNSDYAIKRVIFSAKGYDTKEVEMVVREVQCLAKLGHENVVRYYTSWLEPIWNTGSSSFDPTPTTNTEASKSAAAAASRAPGLDETVTSIDEVATKEEQKEMLSYITNIVSENLREPPLQQQEGRQQSQHHENKGLSAWSFQRSENRDSKVDDWNQLASFKNRSLSIDTISTGGYGNDSEYSEWTVDQSSDSGRYYNNTKSSYRQQQPFNSSNGDAAATKTTSSRFEQWGQKKRQNQHHSKSYKYQICLFIQMELCQSLTLADWIRNRNHTNPYSTEKKRREQYKLAWEICLQLVRGLEHIHSKGIIHRDMKPANVFASRDGKFKIGDFGLSKMLKFANRGDFGPNDAAEQSKSMRTTPPPPTQHKSDSVSSTAIMLPLQQNQQHLQDRIFSSEWQDPLTSAIGTASYAAPEQIASHCYGPEADIFSLGLIVLELFSDFGSEHERAMTFHNCRRRKLPNWCDATHPGKEITSLILSCTNPIPSERPTASELSAKMQATADLELQHIIAEQRRQLNEKDALIEKQMQDLKRMKDELENQKSPLKNNSNKSADTM